MSFLACFTVDVIGSCAFGLECNSFKDSNNQFLTMGKKALESDILTMLKQNFAINFPTIAKFLKVNFFAKGVQKFYDSVVRETVTYREQNKIERKDFLQLLIEIKQSKGKRMFVFSKL